MDDTANIKVEMPTKLAKKLANGKKCILGIRAEELKPIAKGSINATIYSIELLGDSTLISFKEGKDIITAKLFSQDTATKYYIGDNLS